MLKIRMLPLTNQGFKKQRDVKVERCIANVNILSSAKKYLYT